jgi:hypothetical protein
MENTYLEIEKRVIIHATIELCMEGCATRASLLEHFALLDKKFSLQVFYCI